MRVLSTIWVSAALVNGCGGDAVTHTDTSSTVDVTATTDSGARVGSAILGGLAALERGVSRRVIVVDHFAGTHADRG